VRESLNLPPPSPPARHSQVSAIDRWDVESSCSCEDGGGAAAAGREEGLSGTLSIVQRIKQLDQQKKQAVAR
jgi:hypothetical protein